MSLKFIGNIIMLNWWQQQRLYRIISNRRS